MLTFVGLGLYDLDDISLKGMHAIEEADHVYLESYTSRLMGTDPAAMEKRYNKPIHILKREDVEQHPEPVLTAAKTGNVVFLTGGDPMVSTTHSDIRIRAVEQGIVTRIIHGASIASAVCGLSGLQNYRFGKSCSVPYPAKNWFPKTPFETIKANLKLDLHTIVFLDIQENRYMSVREGVEILEKLSTEDGTTIPLYVGMARAGSPEPVVIAGTAEKMLKADFGSPLHIIVIPAQLHPVEEEYLNTFADL